MNPQPGCELCNSAGGEVLWQNGLCRVVSVEEPGYPGFCRVILQRHVPEMTDLGEGERAALMRVVWAVEEAIREAMGADKMNVASLGNMTPHVHWHVIPRFRDDRHYPAPVWAAPRHEIPVSAERIERAGRIAAALRARLGA